MKTVMTEDKLWLTSQSTRTTSSRRLFWGSVALLKHSVSLEPVSQTYFQNGFQKVVVVVIAAAQCHTHASFTHDLRVK